jgi:hypothetical protein
MQLVSYERPLASYDDVAAVLRAWRAAPALPLDLRNVVPGSPAAGAVVGARDELGDAAVLALGFSTPAPLPPALLDVLAGALRFTSVVERLHLERVRVDGPRLLAAVRAHYGLARIEFVQCAGDLSVVAPLLCELTPEFRPLVVGLSVAGSLVPPSKTPRHKLPQAHAHTLHIVCGRPRARYWTQAVAHFVGHGASFHALRVHGARPNTLVSYLTDMPANIVALVADVRSERVAELEGYLDNRDLDMADRRRALELLGDKPALDAQLAARLAQVLRSGNVPWLKNVQTLYLHDVPADALWRPALLATLAPNAQLVETADFGAI